MVSGLVEKKGREERKRKQGKGGAGGPGFVYLHRTR